MLVWTDAHLSPALAPQVLWLTCGNTTSAAMREILTTAWPRVAVLLVAGEPLIEIGGRAT